MLPHTLPHSWKTNKEQRCGNTQASACWYWLYGLWFSPSVFRNGTLWSGVCHFFSMLLRIVTQRWQILGWFTIGNAAWIYSSCCFIGAHSSVCWTHQAGTQRKEDSVPSGHDSPSVSLLLMHTYREMTFYCECTNFIMRRRYISLIVSSNYFIDSECHCRYYR